MTPVERQGMIDALLLDDVRIITEDLKEGDDNYLMFLLEQRKPYSEWKDFEIEEAYHGLD